MKEPNFEEALAKLEMIVEELEKGNLTLDEALARYEEGVRLSRLCAHKLKEVEGRVELIMREGQEIKRIPFDQTEEVG